MLLPNLPPPEEGVRHREANTEAFINQTSLGTGTLYIAESRVSWAKSGEEKWLSLEYPHIAIHAVSRDLAHFSHPCLYLMIDVKLEPDNTSNEADSDSEEEEDAAMTEVRFVPSDHTSLDLMYKTLNDCQVLHPDPEDQPSDDDFEEEDEDEGDYDVSENGDHTPGVYEEPMEGDLENIPVGRLAGSRSDGEDEVMETGQFDDAEDENY